MKARLSLITAMLIFGTIGIFVRYIPLPSAVIAMSRGFIGVLFLLLLSLLGKKPLSVTAIRKNLLLLLISGTAIGLNWVLLFEAYRYTTVATATLCYYLAPIFVIILSPLVLKERLTVKKILCALCAILGMVFLSGVTDGTIGGVGDLRGVFLGVGAAVLYASIVLMNRKISAISAYDKTMVQLGASTIVLLIYNLFGGGLWEIRAVVTANSMTPVLLLVLGIVHTGIAYTLYFGSLSAESGMSSQTAAVLSYIDPASAILLSAIFLREPMTGSGIIGTVLILGAAIVSEISLPTRRKSPPHPDPGTPQFIHGGFMKKTFYTELAYLLGVVTLALGTAMMEAANFGVSMVVAPAYIIYSKASEFFPFVTFGMAEYFTQAILLILLALVVRQFRVSYLFSFATTIFYGLVLDGWMALIGLLGTPDISIRHLFYWVGLVVCALGVAFLFHTYISQEVYELFVAEVSRKYHLPLGRLKLIYDCASCCVAVLLSFLLFGFGEDLHGVKWGTVVCALLNGNVIHWIDCLLEKHFDFRDRLKLRRFFEK